MTQIISFQPGWKNTSKAIKLKNLSSLSVIGIQVLNMTFSWVNKASFMTIIGLDWAWTVVVSEGFFWPQNCNIWQNKSDIHCIKYSTWSAEQVSVVLWLWRYQRLWTKSILSWIRLNWSNFSQFTENKFSKNLKSVLSPTCTIQNTVLHTYKTWWTTTSKTAVFQILLNKQIA